MLPYVLTFAGGFTVGAVVIATSTFATKLKAWVVAAEARAFAAEKTLAALITKK